MLTLVSRHLWDRLAFWGPITLLINVYVSFPFPFWPPGLVFLVQGSLSKAGAGGRCAGGQGLRVALGFPEALLPAVIAAHRVGDRWQCCRGKQDGKQPLASAPRVCIAPRHPGNSHKRKAPAHDPTIGPVLLRPPRSAYPACNAPSPWHVCVLCATVHVALCAWWGHSRETGDFYLQGGQVLLPHLDRLRFPCEEAWVPFD